MRYLNIILLACGLLACSEDFGTRAFYDCRNDQDCAAGNYCEFIEISQEAQDALWNGGNAPEGVGICLRRGRDAGIVNQCDPNEGDWPRACPPGCQEAELNCIEGRLSDCGCPVPVEDAMVDDQGVDGADGGLDPDMRPLQECVPGDFYWDDQCPEDHQPEDEDLTGLCQPCGEYDGWIMRRCNDDGLGYTRLCVECMPEERVVHGQCADGTVQHRTCNDDRSWDNPTPPCDDNCREDGQSLPEDCNGIDDDCDGMTDEGHDGGATLERACFAGPHQNFAGIGQCVMGLQICGPDGEWLECSGYVEPTEEVCDGLDNDCNRITDDGLDGQPCYSGPDGTAGVGLCRIGSTNCNGNELTCRNETTPAPEICDGRDNDCDGESDEGVPGGCECGEEGEDQPCYPGPEGTEGVGACRAGIQLCIRINGGLRWGSCNNAVLPSFELCDFQDNDCDGVVNNGYNPGAPCDNGRNGVCFREGVLACTPNGNQGCELQGDPVVPSPEECDHRDNDCDGDIDEGVLNACQMCGEPPAELCNDFDDDCDGQIDEAFGALGDVCIIGVGECERRGVMICVADDEVNCSVEQGPASPEVCDGLDNDCDGEVDDGLEGCICEPTNGGVEQCDEIDNDCDGEVDEGLFNQCGECGVPDPEEVCNGQDDDCDDEIDEDLELNACGLCGPLPEEVCNGRDDDCDDEIDETFEDLGDECFAGVGDCRQAGVMVCDGARGGTRCNAEPRLPQAEVCDEIDNDCDGQVDEGEEINCACERTNGGVEICDGIDNDCDRQIDEAPTDEELGNQCFNGVGQCEAQGTMVCADGELRCNAQLGQPADEICNALDDDCDGTVDEGVANACGECGPDPVELCNDRDDDCDGEIDEGVQNACGGCGDVPNEVCDGADNDCDGEIDEGVQNACGGCGDLPPDICDGVDSDCDGTTDEDAPLEPQGPPNCIVGTGICQRSGHELCANGELTCNATPGEPQDEVCGNDRDDDCDGDIDEADCDAGCIETNGGVEICDGLDNDCDGDTDEAAVDVGVECRNEQCTAQGTSACVDGVLTCDVTHAVLLDGSLVACQAQDSCGGDGRGDRVDNDCDGRVDESCNCAGAPRQTNCWTRDNNGQCVRGDVTQRTCNGNQWGVCEYTGP